MGEGVGDKMTDKQKPTLEELTLNEGILCRLNGTPVKYDWMNGPRILKIPYSPRVSAGRNYHISNRITESAPNEANAYLKNYGENVAIREPMGGSTHQQFRSTSVTHVPVMYFRIEQD